MREKNDELISLARKYPKLMPIASVHPYDNAAALVEVKRLAAAGVKVIKLHPHTQAFDIADPRVLELVKLAGKMGIVILMDNANIVPGDSQNLFNLAIQCAETQFVFAHLGGFELQVLEYSARRPHGEGPLQGQHFISTSPRSCTWWRNRRRRAVRLDDFAMSAWRMCF